MLEIDSEDVKAIRHLALIESWAIKKNYLEFLVGEKWVVLNAATQWIRAVGVLSAVGHPKKLGDTIIGANEVGL